MAKCYLHTKRYISVDLEAKKNWPFSPIFASKMAKMKIVTKNDSPPGHSSAFTVDFIASRGIKLFEHTPYSTNLAPWDFWLFPRLKFELSGKKYDNLEEV